MARSTKPKVARAAASGRSNPIKQKLLEKFRAASAEMADMIEQAIESGEVSELLGYLDAYIKLVKNMADSPWDRVPPAAKPSKRRKKS